MTMMSITVSSDKLPDREDPSPFFARGMSIPEDRRFPRERHTYFTSRHNLCGNSSDHSYVEKKWMREPEREHSGSRVGAYYPWPPSKAGEKTEKHLRTESPSTLIGIELESRPLTNLPGDIRMAFGRATPGYYAHKYPNRETWCGAKVMQGRDMTSLYSLPRRTLNEYEICNEQQFKYLASLPETTEYQDKYLAHLPTEKKRVSFRG
ncbi:hypothetical protein PHET_04285 [Paragonimus heterotremus]|uniref:Uncharacterized protein n=1 Tax=Paragonimus heterotremus TaxID=100268 RepID=A0A8J4WH16_9TREM|nr:hypothetical protein PHET_04285 [Paragonimus heterotremus]